MASWFSPFTQIQTYRNILPPAPEPPVFNPRDISDCVLWLDANDTSTIDVNGDLSGANVNRVMKWFDKAKPANQNYYTHVGDPSTSGLYNVHFMNKLNTVYFQPNCYMDHHGKDLVFSFQARTFFAVIKPLTDLCGSLTPYINIYNTLTAGGMNTGISWNSMTGLHQYAMCENGVSCGIVFDLSNNPLNQRMILMFAQTDQLDLSGNIGSFDTISQPLTQSDPADNYYTGASEYRLNDSTNGTAQDIAEILMYGRLLSQKEQIQVLEYLADKWNLSGPTGDLALQSSGIAALEESTPPPSYTYIIYGQFVEGLPPSFFWCDENAQLESPPVLADGYDGTTALRDGLAVVVSGVFYA